MQNMDIAVPLNSRLACPRCHAGGAWAEAARPKVRQNSVIHQLRCTRCGERVAAKVSGGRQWQEDHRLQLQNEYATLCDLRSVFSENECLGILEPLACMEVAERSVLVTRWFAGTDLVRHARGAEMHAVERAFRLAGNWLLALHGADGGDRPLHSLGVPEKVENLTRTYGAALGTQAEAERACGLLAHIGRDLETLTVRPVRLHGDFKPQNLLHDGTRCVGLDIHWGIVGAAVYDLAPFLNHLWLAGIGRHGLPARGRHRQAEAAFLGGYGGVASMQALRWAQLYFALCHLGSYRQRGSLGVAYANWKVLPLVRRLEDQLREMG